MARQDVAGELIQGAIALVIVLGAFGLAALSLYRGESPSVAIAIITAAVGPIAGFYFGQRAAIVGVTHATNGMTDSALKMAAQHQSAEQAPGLAKEGS